MWKGNERYGLGSGSEEGKKEKEKRKKGQNMDSLVTRKFVVLGAGVEARRKR